MTELLVGLLMSLGLWVGGTGLMLFLYGLDQRAETAPKNRRRGGLLVASGLGCLVLSTVLYTLAAEVLT